jgi:hypothetical protein
MAAELRQRIPGPAVDVPGPASIPTVSVNGKGKDLHPSGKAKHGRFMAAARSVTWAIYFLTSAIAFVSLHSTVVSSAHRSKAQANVSRATASTRPN